MMEVLSEEPGFKGHAFGSDGDAAAGGAPQPRVKASEVLSHHSW